MRRLCDWLELLGAAAMVLLVVASAHPASAQTKNVPTAGTYYTGPATPVICVDPATGTTSACASGTAGNVTVTGPVGTGTAATGVRSTLDATDAAALQSIVTNTAAPTPAGTNVIGHVIVDTTSTTAVTQATAANLNATVVGTGAFADQSTLQTQTDTTMIGGVNIKEIGAAAPSLTNPLWVANASVTPAAGTAHAIVTGGVAVTLVTGPVKGCYIVNPLTATDEGIATVEPAYVNAVTTATTSTLNGSSTALQPGQSWNCVPGQTTSVSANALTSSHNLVVVVW